MNPNYEDLSAWNLNDANNPMSNTNSYYPGGPGFPGGGPGYPGGGPGYPGGGPCYPAGGPGFPGGGGGGMGQGFPPPAPCQGAPLGYPGPDPAGFPPSGSMGFGYPAQGYPQTDSNYGGARQYIPGAPICPSQPSCGTMDSFSYNDSDYGRSTDRNPYSEPNRSCQSNSYKDIFNPTVKDAPNFDAEADCERLRKAMAGLGTNEKELIDVMAHRSPAQRVAITRKYKALFGKDLTSKFRSELSGHFLDCMIALCLSPAEFDASELYKAMKGLGTDEDVLIEILCSRTNEQIREIKDAYGRNRTRQMTVEEVRGLMKQLTDKFNAKDNGDLYNMAHQPVSGGGNAIEQIEHVKNHLIKYVRQDKDFSVALSQAKIGNVISADFDESDDSYLLTIHLDKPMKTEQPTKTSRRPSENRQSQKKPAVPTKSVTPNKPSSPASGSVPNSPEKTSQADSIPEEIKAAHDRYREVEEYPLEPTLKPSPDFDPDKDCEKLHQAMAGMGTNEKAVIEIMGHRSSEQRVVITQRYKSIFGKDLTSKFKSEMSGALYDCMKALCYSPVELDARELRRAVEGAGTDEDALIEILCSRTNDQIKQIKETYTKVFPNRDLENDIKGDTSRHFKRVCVALLQANRDESTKVDTELARRDAESLYRAGEQKLGTDESKFVQILVSRSYAHLRLVFEEYTTIGKRNIEDTLKAEMHGDTLRAFLSIVSCIKNKPKYFAEKLHKSMKGLGTDNKTLIRIIVSRCEIDLGIIKKEFQSLTGKTLEAYIHAFNAVDVSSKYLHGTFAKG
ncbi:unnamed protein product [Trichobilharzia szidati]|nr:unnamed protein product [Trichobilharzia szidati]